MTNGRWRAPVSKSGLRPRMVKRYQGTVPWHHRIISTISYRHCLQVLASAGWQYHKIGHTSLHSKVVKFDHYEIGIVYHLPCTQELDGVSGTNPVLDDVGSIFAMILRLYSFFNTLRMLSVIALVLDSACKDTTFLVNTKIIRHFPQKNRGEVSLTPQHNNITYNI